MDGIEESIPVVSILRAKHYIIVLHEFDPGSAVSIRSVKMNIPLTASTKVLPIRLSGYVSDEFTEVIERVADELLSDLTMLPNSSYRPI